MKCERCGARIYYRFLTNCGRCGCEIKGASVPPNISIPNHQLDQPVEPTLTWKQEAINVVHIFISSIAGLISGAVVVYFSVALIYLALSEPPSPHAGCGWGSVIGFFSLVSGAVVGTVGGSVLAVKNPLCKGVQSVRLNGGA